MAKSNKRNALLTILVSFGLVVAVGACGAPEAPPAPETGAQDPLTELDEGLRGMEDMRPNVLECLNELENCLTDGADVESCKEELAELCRPPHPPMRDGERPEGERPEGERPEHGDHERGDMPPPRGERPEGDRPEGDRPEGERPEGDRPEGERGERPEGDRPEGDRPEGERGERPQQGEGMRRPPMPNLRPCFEGLFECVGDGEMGACFDDARSCVEANLTEHRDHMCERGLEHCQGENAPADRCEALADRCEDNLPE